MRTVAATHAGPRTLDAAEYLLLAYVTVVPFGSAITVPAPAPLDDLSSLVGAAASVALAHRFVTRRDVRGFESVGPHLWLFLVAVMGLSWFWSITPTDTFAELIVHALLVAQAYIAAVQGYSSRFRQSLLPSLSVSAAVTGLIATLQWSTGTLTVTEAGTSRFALVGDDANITAAALLLPVAAALVLGQQDPRRGPAARRHLIAAALGILAIVLTASRGGLIGLTVVVLFTTLRSRSPRVWLPTLALTAAVVPLFPAASRGTASTGRTSIWRIGIESCNERCWFGSGLGTFPDVHQQLALANPEIGTTQLRFEAHNIFIGALVEVGFVGAFLLVAVFATALAGTFVLDDRLGRAACAGVSAVLVANLLISNLAFKYTWLALLIATIAAARPLDEPSRGGARR